MQHNEVSIVLETECIITARRRLLWRVVDEDDAEMLVFRELLNVFDDLVIRRDEFPCKIEIVFMPLDGDQASFDVETKPMEKRRAKNTGADLDDRTRRHLHRLQKKREVRQIGRAHV